MHTMICFAVMVAQEIQSAPINDIQSFPVMLKMLGKSTD